MDFSTASPGCERPTKSQLPRHTRNAETVFRGLRSLEQALSSVLESATHLCEELQTARIREDIANVARPREVCPMAEWDASVPAERSYGPDVSIFPQTAAPAIDDDPCCAKILSMALDPPFHCKSVDTSDAVRDTSPRVAGFCTRASAAECTNVETASCSHRSSGAAASTQAPSGIHNLDAATSNGRSLAGTASTPLRVWTSVVDEEMVVSQWEALREARPHIETTVPLPRKISVTTDSYVPGITVCDLIIHPMSAQRMAWDVASVILLAIDIVAAPLQFAFGLGHTISLVYFQWLLSAFWATDVVMSFRTGFFRTDGRVERDPKLIAMQYLTSWFFLDFGVVSLELLGNLDMSEPRGVSHARIFNRVSQYARAARVLRFAKMPGKLHLLSEAFFRNFLLMRLCFSMVKMAAGLLIMVHVLSCGWYFVGQLDERGWVHSDGEGIADVDFSQQYVSSARWVLAQVNGRTDQKYERTMREQWYVVFCAIIAIVFMSLFISGLTTRMCELQKLLDSQKKDMRLLNRFLDRHRCISWSARHIAKHYVEARGGHHNTVEEETQVLNMLPDALKQDLLCEIRSPQLMSHLVVRTISHFTTGHLIHALCTHIKPIVAASMTMIFVRNESCNKVIIVERGKCIYSQKGHLKLFVAMWLQETLGTNYGSYSYVASGGKLVKKMLAKKRHSWGSGGPLIGSSGFTDDMQVVKGGSWMSEAALWLPWVTRGDFLSTSNLTALAMDADTFQEVGRRHQELLPAFAVFARAFLSNSLAEATASLRRVPSSSYAVTVSDFIDESERARLYDIDECPSTPMMRTSSRASPASFADGDAESSESDDGTEEPEISESRS